jgi:hypothetical protein
MGCAEKRPLAQKTQGHTDSKANPYDDRLAVSIDMRMNMIINSTVLTQKKEFFPPLERS